MNEQESGSPPPVWDLHDAVTDMMEAAWREPGFCVPNQATYPQQWLWDSCFHAIIWAALDSGRCVTEISSALESQGDDGFVPHMTYRSDPDLHADFWGRSGASSITQPPMYGHAIAEVVRSGFVVPDDLIDRARNGLANLASRPRTDGGLIPVFHPWETGCDDSARWDSWLPSTIADGDRPSAWRARKGEYVSSLELGADGQAVGNEKFTVGSIGFNALVAWNAAELLAASAATGQIDRDVDELLASLVDELSNAVAARWDEDRWTDDGPISGRARTLDGMLGLLVDPRFEGFEALVDPDAYGAAFGPRGVHRAEETYDPMVYWRGPAWPQLSYLLMIAADRAGEDAITATLAQQLVDGAEHSGLAEYWHPDSGQGLGAIPQSWAGLGLVARYRFG